MQQPGQREQEENAIRYEIPGIHEMRTVGDTKEFTVL